jgi:hypothetical protein
MPLARVRIAKVAMCIAKKRRKKVKIKNKIIKKHL